MDSYSIPVNIGKTETKGIEFSIRTSKIKPLNLDFQVTGSYNFIKYQVPVQAIPAIQIQVLDNIQILKYPNVPIDTLIGMIYQQRDNWNDRLQINYYAKYTMPDLGLWITFRAEQLVWEKNQSKNISPIDFNIAGSSDIAEYLFSTSVKRKPNKWLFNLSMSKSLFRGAEVSFYVNNFIDDPAIYRYYSSLESEVESVRNPSLFYGIEFSMTLDKLFGSGGQSEEN